MNNSQSFDKEKIIKEAKRIEEDSLYSCKSHFNAGQRYHNVNFWIGLISTVLSAVAGALALNKFLYHYIIAGSLALIVAGLAAILTFVNPSEKETFHKNAGNKFKSLQNDSRIFYETEIEGIDDEKALDKLKRLNERRNELNNDSPLIPNWAFKKARKGIERGESDYKIDKE